MENTDKFEHDLQNAKYKINELSQWKRPQAMKRQSVFHEPDQDTQEFASQLLKVTAQLQQETAKREQTEKKLHTCQTRVRRLASKLQLSEERERQRLAQDLHDTVAQCLAGCRFKLESLQADLPSGTPHIQVNECLDFIDQAIKQTRLLMFEFYPWTLAESGLETTLRSLAHRVQQVHGIHVECIGDGTADTLDKELGILLFRTIRELVLNVVKHAKAQHVTISISSIRNRIRIIVVDDGVGFNIAGSTAKREKKDGFGLFSVRERLGQVGGRLNLISHLGQGTQAEIVILRQRDPN
jgi:signal transduction histidine kinase